MSIALVLAFLTNPTPANVASPQRWQLDQQPKQCVALRERAGPQNGVAITVRPFEKYHDVAILTPKSGTRRGAQAATVVIPGLTIDRKTYTRVREPANSTDGVFTITLSGDELRSAANAGMLTARVGGASHLVSMKGGSKVLAALFECQEKLIAAMGIKRDWVDPPVEASDFSRLISADDYPSEMIEQDQEGGVTVLLEIDPTGAVTRCGSYQLFGDPMFEKVACSAIGKRARFSPARDAVGNPVKSYFLSPTIWFVMD